MKRIALLALLAVPAAVLAAFATSDLPAPSVVLRVTSATGAPVAVTGTVIGPVEPDRNPVARLDGTTPYEVAVPPGDFAAAFWRSGDGPGLVVEIVEGTGTTRSWAEPAYEHVLVDRRGGAFYIAGSALDR